MRFVIPVTHSDKHLLTGFIENLKLLSGFKHHSITLAPCPSLFSEAQSHIPALQSICASVECASTSREPEGSGWVPTVNWMFQDAVIGLAQRQNKEAFMWLPLDHVPYRAGWQDAIETIYNGAQLPFLGRIRDLASVSPTKEQGRFMHPNAVYPANLYDIAQSEFQNIGTQHPYYVSMRWRIFNSGVKEVDMGHWIQWTQEGPVPQIAAQVAPPLAPFKEVSLNARLLDANYRQIIQDVWAAEHVSNTDIFMALGIPSQPVSVVQPGGQGDPGTGTLSPFETLETENMPEPGIENEAPPMHAVTSDAGTHVERIESEALASPRSELARPHPRWTPMFHDGSASAGKTIHEEASEVDIVSTSLCLPVAEEREEVNSVGGSQTASGQSILNELTLRIARKGKPCRVREWAEELQVPLEDLRSLIKSNPESGLYIATAGWVSIASAQ